MKKKSWGFDLRDRDTSVRPQDDFFNYANGGWFKKTTMPPEESRWGTFNILRKKTELELKKILASLMRKKSAPRGSEAQQIRDLYRSGMDMKARNALDTKPLAPLLAKIKKLKNTKDLLKLIPELHRLGVGVLWGAYVDQDEKNAEIYIMHLFQGGIGLPDREYYLQDKPEQIRVRAAYRIHVAKMFMLLGESQNEAEHKASSVIAFETRLAKASMKKEDAHDPDKTYHKTRLEGLPKHFPWQAYFSTLGVRPPASVNLRQPEFVRTVDLMIKEVPLADWQTYLTWHVVAEAAPHLSGRFIQASFNFYGKVLTGTPKMRPLWRRSLAVTNMALGEALGKIYVEKYFPPEAKQKMDELISNLFAAYEVRIMNLDWMGAITKKRALKKLHAIARKIGYPKKWKSYKGLGIDPADYFGNVLRSSLYEHRRNMRKLGKKVDREEWHMTPQTVNAYYNPGTNEIAFPAAILQPPYFGPKLDDAVNYGAIGGVIGHEITHGFDDDGSKFDEKGNLRKWWTKEDRKRFESKTKVLKEQFDAYELHDVHVNGELTLGENIADLGGYAIALDAYGRHLEKVGSKNIDGLTPIQRFFYGAAQDWRNLSRPEAEKTLILIDPHAPPIYRINGPASNLPEFYGAFGVKKGDKLYREPKKRAKIW